MSSSIDLSEVYSNSGLSEILDQLDSELVGLKPVKTRIKEIAALLLVEKARQSFDLSSSRPGLHMSFTGRPGTGKTSIAKRISEILNKLGYLRKGHLIAVTRDDLVGQYVGHTAPKTKEIIKRAYGGVLFIDEAYYLYKPGNERDYGAEVIEILLQEMEKNNGEFVVIFAGYKDRMNDFYESNPGLFSRVSHHIDFPDYTEEELLSIANLLLKEEDYIFSDDAYIAFQEYIKKRRDLPFFANARSIRNALDRTRLRQAHRLFLRMGDKINREDLMTIEESDITSSRVFNGEVEDLDLSIPLTDNKSSQ